MSAETVSRWARRFVLAGAGFLVAWGVAALVGVPRGTEVALGLFGFVLHTLFGKAYSLIPSYFDRELAVPRAPAAHLPLSLLGAAGLVAATLPSAPDGVGSVGAALWAAGAAVFLGAILASIRDNLSGGETGTSEANADRRPVDRLANGFMPVALAYLAAGSYAVAAPSVGLPPLIDGYPPRATHLLAAGTAATLVFAVGFRLLPRFLVAHPPRALVAVVLPAGALGPALIATGLPSGTWFRAGAALEAAAVIGFAAAYAALFVRSDRRRVGFYGPLLGGLAGAGAVSLGLWFAFVRVDAGLVGLHLRLNLLGFLGLTIVGVAYQFYPPGVGTFAGAGDRTALASIGCLGGGLLVEAAGSIAGLGPAEVAGRAVALVGALLYSYLLVGLFYERYWSRGR